MIYSARISGTGWRSWIEFHSGSLVWLLRQTYTYMKELRLHGMEDLSVKVGRWRPNPDVLEYSLQAEDLPPIV